MPPSISTLFWASIPLVLAAIFFQIGIPPFVTSLIPDLLIIKIIRNIFTTSTTHCYVSVKTLTPGLPNAECFSVSNGIFSRVFLDDTSYEMTKEARTGHVIPGLWDGHGHLLQYGELLHSANLFGADSMEDVHKTLIEYKASHSEAGTSEHWLRGVGWDQASFGRWPEAVSLTDIFCSFITSACLTSSHYQYLSYCQVAHILDIYISIYSC